MKQRLAYVDAAKGISILMIMMGHITSLANPLDWWMSSFKVSIFYIISGFLICYTGSVYKRSFTEFTRKILQSLAVPYLWFSALGIASKVFISYSKYHDWQRAYETFQDYLWDSLFLKGINSMWFLPTIFIGEIIFYILCNAPLFFRLIYAVVGAFGVTGARMATDWLDAYPVTQDMVLTMENAKRLIAALGKGIDAAWFLGAGYLIYLFYQKLSDLRIGTALKAVFGVLLSGGNLYLSQINTGVDFNLLKEGKYPVLFYLCGLIGSLGMIMLLDVLSEVISLEFLNFWGENSLIIMCTHTVLGFKRIAYDGWDALCGIPKHAGWNYIFECFCVLGVLLLMEYTLIVFINERFPFLIGRKKKGTV